MSKSVSIDVKCIHTAREASLTFPSHPDPCKFIIFTRNDISESLTIFTKELSQDPVPVLKKLCQFLEPESRERPYVSITVQDDYQMHIAYSGEHLFFTYQGEETIYWDQAEFVEDAECVLGAICGTMLSVDIP
tara:strand:+ start:2015 stop:2413 length:399 start_codon:yes stop_codon:yes gene_type:complete